MPRKGSSCPDTLKAKESEAYARNGHARWTDDEIELVMADSHNDFELSKKIGRSMQAIRARRCIVNKARGR